jgi:hypothetical protein
LCNFSDAGVLISAVNVARVVCTNVTMKRTRGKAKISIQKCCRNWHNHTHTYRHLKGDKDLYQPVEGGDLLLKKKLGKGVVEVVRTLARSFTKENGQSFMIDITWFGKLFSQLNKKA